MDRWALLLSSALATACSSNANLLITPADASSLDVPSPDAGGDVHSTTDLGTTSDVGADVPVNANDANGGTDIQETDAAMPFDVGTDLPLVDTGTDVASAPDASTCPLPGRSASLIDDGSWPGANAQIIPQCGRVGGWFTVNDGLALQSPGPGAPFGPFLTVDPPSGAAGYVRTTATLSLAGWGAAISFGFDEPATTGFPYDGSAYTGVSFWIKTGTGNNLPNFIFAVATSQTRAIVDDPYHETTLPLPAPGVWTHEVVLWTALAQPTWAAMRVPFDPTSLEFLQWQDASEGPDQTLDISIGDIEFVTE